MDKYDPRNYRPGMNVERVVKELQFEKELVKIAYSSRMARQAQKTYYMNGGRNHQYNPSDVCEACRVKPQQVKQLCRTCYSREWMRKRHGVKEGASRYGE